MHVDIAADLLPRLDAPIHVHGSLRAGRLLTLPLRREMLDLIEAPRSDLAAETGRRMASLLEVLVRSHTEPEPPDLRPLRPRPTRRRPGRGRRRTPAIPGR